MIETLNKISTKILNLFSVEASVENLVKLDAVILTLVVVIILLFVYLLINKFLLSKNINNIQQSSSVVDLSQSEKDSAQQVVVETKSVDTSIVTNSIEVLKENEPPQVQVNEPLNNEVNILPKEESSEEEGNNVSVEQK